MEKTNIVHEIRELVNKSQNTDLDMTTVQIPDTDLIQVYIEGKRHKCLLLVDTIDNVCYFNDMTRFNEVSLEAIKKEIEFIFI